MTTAEPYRIFLSAVSGDLRSFRQLATDLIREHAAEIAPGREIEIVVQEEFGADYGTIRDMIDRKLRPCDFVIAIVGHCYGFGPDGQPEHLDPPRSYTQLEVDAARRYNKQLALFWATDEAELDANCADTPEQAEWQRLYRNALERELPNQLRNEFSTREQFAAQIRSLRPLAGQGTLPRQPNNVTLPTLGTLFKGRDELLAQLLAQFDAWDWGSGSEGPKCVLHGMGGVGKTQLAVEHARRHADRYKAILFASASDPTTLRSNIAGLVGVIKGDLQRYIQIENEEEQFAAVLEWLDQHPGWLLLLDNVDDDATADAVRELLGSLRRGHVVITSRIANFSSLVTPLEVDVLSQDAAIAYLLDSTDNHRRKRDDDTTVAAEIATDLDGLALALQQASAQVREDRLTLGEYRELWQTTDAEALSWFEEHKSETGYPRSLATTYETSWKQLSFSAKRLLEHLCWLAPDPIPDFFLLDDSVRAEWARVLKLDDVTVMALRKLLSELASHSLLTWVVEKQGQSEETYDANKLHRVIASLARWKLNQESSTLSAIAIIRLENVMNHMYRLLSEDSGDISEWRYWIPLEPHVRHTLRTSRLAADPDLTAWLTDRLATLQLHRCYFDDAERLFRHALAILEANDGSDGINTGHTKSNLGACPRNLVPAGRRAW